MHTDHLHILYMVFSMLGVILGYEPLTITHRACHLMDILLYFTGNSSQLDLVDTALFSLSLDDHHTDDLVKTSKQFLYGDAGSRSVV